MIPGLVTKLDKKTKQFQKSVTMTSYLFKVNNREIRTKYVQNQQY